MVSDDVLASWKQQRFAVVDAQGWDMEMQWIVVLTDVAYWSHHLDQLDAWCSVHGCERQGMTVEIDTPQLMTLFKLKWSGGMLST